MDEMNLNNQQNNETENDIEITKEELTDIPASVTEPGEQTQSQAQPQAQPAEAQPEAQPQTQPGAQVPPYYGSRSAYNNYNPQNPPVYTQYGQPQPQPQKVKKAKKEKKKMSRGAFAALVLVGAILLSSLASFGVLKLAGFRPAGNNAATETNEGGITVNKVEGVSDGVASETGAGSVAAAAALNADSVVVITTEMITTSSYFGQYVTQGAGSGVIIDEAGYIITCAHVIEGATTIKVTLNDGKEYEAKTVGSDEETDIAVIKIEADETLNSVTVGDSDALVVGQTAITIGNPLGTLGGSVGDGIISALSRQIKIDGRSYELIQTSASVNPGNSGGGLFDIDGNLIGIVNAKSSGTTSDGSIVEDIAFAIPINRAIEVANQLMTNGYVAGRPQLGVYLVDIASTNDLYSLLQSNYSPLYSYVTTTGTYFAGYVEGQDGDLQFGDRVIALDGTEVSTRADVLALLSDYKVGDEVTLTVARLKSSGSKSTSMVDVKVTLIEKTAQNNENDSGSAEENGNPDNGGGGYNPFKDFGSIFGN